MYDFDFLPIFYDPSIEVLKVISFIGLPACLCVHVQKTLALAITIELKDLEL